MRFGIRTLDELDVRGKTVLCRVDINQPVDRAKGTLKSVNRIRACVPTVRELSDKGAKVVLMAHQGSDIEYKNFYTTRPHAQVLSELLGREVKWIDDVCGPAAREDIAALREGEVLLTCAAPRPGQPSPRSGRARCCCWTTCGSWRRSRPSLR